MIHFQRIDLTRKEDYLRLLRPRLDRGCAYSFANLILWGRQRVAFLDNYLVIFSQFGKSSIYPFPAGTGDVKPVLDAIICDAKERGIVCRITGLSAEDCMLLEELYPGKLRFYPDRDGCDYVYKIEDLAELKGRKYQKKRNHVNRFWQNHPNCKAEILTAENLPLAQKMLDAWFAQQDAADDYHLEQLALQRAFDHLEELDFEGMLLTQDGQAIAFTLGSALSDTVFDIHFEKALDGFDGSYAAINQAFARHLWEKYPHLEHLNREDDMGLPGLRKAKLSYQPDHLIVKFWARLWEDEDED